MGMLSFISGQLNKKSSVIESFPVRGKQNDKCINVKAR